MAPQAIERHGITAVGYHDLKERPAFKIDLQEVDGRWFLYLGHFWHEGWSILDVTDPSNPTYLRFIEGPENTSTGQVQVADGLMITALEQPLGGWGHVDKPSPDPSASFEESAYLWDVATDPENPELLGHYERGGTGTHRNFYAGGDYAYMAVKLPEFKGRLLEIVDVADPSTPTPVSRWWWPGQHESDPEPTKETYHCHGPAYVRDDIVFLSYGSVGAVILDVTDKTNPELISRLDYGNFGSWLGVHSAIPVPDTDLMVVNDEAILEGTPTEEDGDPLNFVTLVDISDISETRFDGQIQRGPRIISSLPLPVPESDQPYETYHDKPGRFGPHNQHHYRDNETRYKSSEYLVMTWFNAGLRIFDISNPLRPTEIAYFVPEDPKKRIGDRPASGLVTQFEDVVIDSRGFIYCTDKNHGLFILEAAAI